MAIAVARPLGAPGSTLNNVEDTLCDKEKQIQQSSQDGFIGVSRIGRIWSRDSHSSRGHSCLGQVVVRLSSFTIAQEQLAKSETTPASAILSIRTLNDLQGMSNELTTEEVCSICLGEYAVDDQIRILPCGHEYHLVCIGKCKENFIICNHDMSVKCSSIGSNWC